MPFALAADVGFLAIGVILFLLCVGGNYLIEGIAAKLPAASFLGFTLDLGAVFRKITLPVVAFITTIGVLHFKQVENWLRGIGYTLIQTVFGQVQVANTHAGQIAHLHNVTIPDAASAAVATAHGYTATQVQGVRDQVHVAQLTWEQAHSYADAVDYINLERTAPSVAHAELALNARTLIASEAHAQDLHDQLKSYVDAQVIGLRGWVDAGVGARVQGVEGAIAIPRFVPGAPAIPVEAITDGTITAVGVAVAVIAAKIVDCLVSSCAGNNNFKQLLQDALGLVALADFAVFLQQLVENPAGTVAGIAGTVGPIVHGGEKTASDVWGDIEAVLGL